MNTSRLFSALLISALVAACGTTPPSNYYMLTADAQGTPSDAGVSIGVGPVEIPDYLKERSMILSRNDHLLSVSNFDRWAEPLEAGILRVLILNLSVLMDTQQAYAFPWRSDAAPEYGVRVSVVQLSVGETSALLSVSWSLHHARTGALVHKALTQLQAPVTDNNAETVADVYSKLLLDLSEAIAAVISRDIESS